MSERAILKTLVVYLLVGCFFACNTMCMDVSAETSTNSDSNSNRTETTEYTEANNQEYVEPESSENAITDTSEPIETDSSVNAYIDDSDDTSTEVPEYTEEYPDHTGTEDTEEDYTETENTELEDTELDDTELDDTELDDTELDDTELEDTDADDTLLEDTEADDLEYTETEIPEYVETEVSEDTEVPEYQHTEPTQIEISEYAESDVSEYNDIQVPEYIETETSDDIKPESSEHMHVTNIHYSKTVNNNVVRSEHTQINNNQYIESESSDTSPFVESQSRQGQPSASVSLHGEKTEVISGEDVLLKLSAVNLITRPPMHVQVIIIPPSGMMVSSSEFVQSGAGQYTTTYELEPGEGRDIEVRIESGQVGEFNVEGRVVYYFGDDIKNAEDYTLKLPIKVKSKPNTIDTVYVKIPGFDAVSLTSMLMGIFVLIRRRVRKQ